MAPLPLFDRQLTIILIHQRRQLEAAAKARNEAEALQQRERIRLLEDLLSLRRSFAEKQRFVDDGASTRNLLKKQIECLRQLSGETGVCQDKKPSGLENFSSMKEEIEAIQRDAETESNMDRIAERLQGLRFDG